MKQYKMIRVGLIATTIVILSSLPAIANAEAQIMYYPVVTAVTAGVLAVLQSSLMLTVGMKRLKYSQGIGDGGYEDLARLIRRHGNLAENAAIFLVVLALLEMTGINHLIVITLASLFIIARFSHALAFSITSGPHPLRAFGAILTAILTIVCSGYLIWTVF